MEETIEDLNELGFPLEYRTEEEEYQFLLENGLEVIEDDFDWEELGFHIGIN
jgi:hypothetical protein